MAFECDINLDSVNPYTGARLTTFIVTYPRIILAQMNTHRVFSRNISSSRAIPVEHMIAKVMDDPFIPEQFPINKAGMSAVANLGTDEYICAKKVWLDARDSAVNSIRELQVLGVHKEIANRLLEPWLWVTAIISSTCYSNFFSLRCTEHAQPEIQKIAKMMLCLYNTSSPIKREWHIPMLGEDYHGKTDIELYGLIPTSVARCARVSYLNHEGGDNKEKDKLLFNRLYTDRHMSPFEHIARASSHKDLVSGNFRGGWVQYRNDIEREEEF